MVDAADSLADAVYRLGFEDSADQEANGYVTEDECYQFADDAAKHLSVEVGIFLGLDTSIDVVAGTAVYSLPATHVFTMLAWIALDAGGVQLLRPTPVASLFALDNAWSATSGASNRFSLDAGSVGTITLYPKPASNGALNQICQEFPGTIDSGSSEVSEMPTVLQDYLTYAMLAGARGKESDNAMPEMSAHFKQRLDLYDQVIEHLWGPGQ